MEEEREIDIFDLLMVLLGKWKLFLLAAVVFALLAAGVKLVQNYRTLSSYEKELADNGDSSLQQAKGKNDDALKRLTGQEVYAARSAAEVNNNITKRGEYLQNSVYMNLDYTNLYEAERNYYLDSEYIFNYTRDNKSDLNDTLTDAYVQLVSNLEDFSPLGLDIDDKYIRELVSVSKTQLNNISVMVVAADAETANQIADYIDSYIKANQESIGESIGAHTINLVDGTVIHKQDNFIMNTQNDNRNAYVKSITDLNTVTGSFSEDQKAVYDYECLAAAAENKQVIEPLKGGLRSGVVKFAVIGFAGGIFLLACIFILIYILSGSVKTEAELKEVMGGVYFGGLPKDRAICEKNIELVLKNKKIKSLAFVSTLKLSEEGRAVIQELSGNLEKLGFEVTVLEDALESAEAMQSMVAAENVIYICSLKKSLLKDMNRLMELSKAEGYGIIGELTAE